MKTKVCTILFFLFPLLASADLTLQQVVDNNTKATGGAAAIEAVQSIRFSLHIAEPSFQVDAVYVADRKGRMRIDIYSGEKRVFTEAYDGQKGWEMDGDGVAKESSAEGSAALLHGILFPGKLFGLHEMAANGHRLELEGRETVDGVNYYVLQLTLKDGYVQHEYVNPETWMIEKFRDVKALHVDLDPSKKWIENRNSDFRNVDGVLRSFHGEQVDLRTGVSMQQTDIKKVETNPRLDDSLFVMPTSPEDSH